MRKELTINFKICVPSGHLDFIINKLACVFIGDNRELTDKEADFLIIEKNTFKCCNTINFFLDYDAPEITLTHLINAQPNELLKWSITTISNIQEKIKSEES